MNDLEDYLALWQTHCEEQQQFVQKAMAKLQVQTQIWTRQRERLLLEVAENSPRWDQLLNSQIKAIQQLNLITQIRAETMLTRQEQERMAFTNRGSIN